jgi:uncharacterized membrane protein
MHGWYGYGAYAPQAFGFPFGIIFMVLLLLALGTAVALAARALRRRDGGGDSAMGILVERFAKGEISKEQFMEMRDLIENRKKK